MKVESIKNNQNFGAKVDENFIKNAQYFYSKRILPIQYDMFQKTVKNLENYGSDSSIISHSLIQENGNTYQILYLKNTDLNNQKAVLLTKKSKFNEVLRYFTKLNEEAIQYCESLL